VALPSSWSANRIPWPFPAPHKRGADGRTVALLAPVPVCTADRSRSGFRPTSRSPIKTNCEVEKRDRGSYKPFSRCAYVASVAWKGLAFQGQRLDTPHKRFGHITAADWRICVACGGGPDRRAKGVRPVRRVRPSGGRCRA